MTVEPSWPRTPSGSGRCPARSQVGQGGDDDRGDDLVCGDHPARMPGQGDDGGDDGEVVAHDHGVGGVQGKVGPARPIAAPVAAAASAGASLMPSPTSRTLAP